MPDYQMMYIKLFNKVTDVITELQQAQRDMEQLYIESSDTELLLLNAKEHGKPKQAVSFLDAQTKTIP